MRKGILLCNAFDLCLYLCWGRCGSVVSEMGMFFFFFFGHVLCVAPVSEVGAMFGFIRMPMYGATYSFTLSIAWVNQQIEET